MKNIFKINVKNSTGQVAIVVLLVSALMLTLGLSMSKQAGTDVKITTNDELLKKAFDTAESGIDYYLGTGNTNYTAPSNDSFATVNVTKIGDGSDKIDFGEFTLVGGVESYWLVNHLVTGEIGTSYFSGPNIDVCGVGFAGSIEVSLFYKTAGKYAVKRWGYNFSSDPTYKVTGFIDSPTNCTTVAMIGSPILLTVSPIFGGGKFYIQALNGGLFASQGLDISSEGSAGGTSVNVNTKASKKVSIRQRYKVPGFLSAGMTADGSVLSD